MEECTGDYDCPVPGCDYDDCAVSRLAYPRPHEPWHDPGVASMVSRAWELDHEVNHRLELADFCGCFIPPASKVLEAGCGTGLVARHLASWFEYTGLDNAAPMLRVARERFPEIDFVQGDLFSVPFADCEFDAVVCFEVLGHLPSNMVKAALAEMTRAAKRIVLFTVWPAESGVVATPNLEIGGALHNAYGEDFLSSSVPGGWELNQAGRFGHEVSGYMLRRRDV